MTDKAVSTEDLCIDLPRNASLEAARLEAVIKTLIENKVESIKNAKRKSSSITSSPKSLFNKLRGTSTSTVSSKDKDEIVSIHSQVSKKHPDAKRTPKSEHRRRKIPHHSSPRKTLQFSDEDGNENFGFAPKEQILDCTETCCCRQNPNEIQIHVDDDFISLNLETEDVTKRAQRKKRRRRRKHHHHHHQRKHMKMTAVAVQVNQLKDLDDDELSQRARMTIVLTAFLLLFMCLLLVGITLRMAPLIDDMVRLQLAMSSPAPILRASHSLENISSSRQIDAAASSRRRKSRARNGYWPSADERKRQRTVYIIVGIFFFILCACVLVVIVTLTHQTEMQMRKENEELMNSLVEESTTNLTASVPHTLK